MPDPTLAAAQRPPVLRPAEATSGGVVVTGWERRSLGRLALGQQLVDELAALGREAHTISFAEWPAGDGDRIDDAVEAEMETIAGLIHEALTNRKDEEALEKIRLQVKEMNSQFPRP